MDNCVANPDLVAALIKLMYDGFIKLQGFIEQPEGFINELVRIYFNYNYHSIRTGGDNTENKD